jgi:hypothetical protein
LRFQLPPSVLPLQVERAVLTLKLTVPGREVTISVPSGNETVVLRRRTAPMGLEQVEIEDPKLLQLDETGGLYFNLVIGDVAAGDGVGSTGTRSPWRIDSLDLEVHGRTPGEGE